jgi:hypothetical protein
MYVNDAVEIKKRSKNEIKPSLETQRSRRR